MRILEINKFYFIKGGAERHFFDVIKLLEKKGHQVAVFSMHHPKNKKSKWEKYFLTTVGYDKNYTLKEKIKGLSRMFYSWESKRKINKLLDDFQPEVVHIHNIYHQLSPIILFEIKKRGIPIIMTVHDYKLVNPNYNLFKKGEFYNRCLDNKFYQCFFDKCVKNSYLKSLIAVAEMYWHQRLGTYSKNINYYISPSEFAKKILVERGVDKNKIVVKSHFIVSFSNKNKQLFYSKVKEKYCLYLGRIVNNKGIGNLVNLFKNIPDLKLYLAGNIDGNFDKKKHSNKNIKYLGYLDKSLLQEYILNSEFIISSSKLPETFGLIALEANGLGKLFFGYKVGAYPEIIKNNQNGFLARSDKELKQEIETFINGNFKGKSKKTIQQLAKHKFDQEKYYIFLTELFNSAMIRR